MSLSANTVLAKTTCNDVITACRQAIEAKNEVIKKTQDALDQTKQDLDKTRQERDKEAAHNGAVYRNPVVLVGAGAVGALAGGPVGVGVVLGVGVILTVFNL